MLRGIGSTRLGYTIASGNSHLSVSGMVGKARKNRGRAGKTNGCALSTPQLLSGSLVPSPPINFISAFHQTQGPHLSKENQGRKRQDTWNKVPRTLSTALSSSDKMFMPLKNPLKRALPVNICQKEKEKSIWLEISKSAIKTSEETRKKSPITINHSSEY